jgi:hypothetical protein
MSGDDGFVRATPPLSGGLDSWPPDLFAFGNWRRLQELGLKSITIEDEYYISELPREWTAAERKYALIIRDPLTYRFDRKLLEWLKDQSNERLTEEVINLDQELGMKWSFSIDIPRVVMDNLEEALSRIEKGHIIRPWRPIFANPQAIKDLRKTFPRLVIDPKTRKIIITGYETGLIVCAAPLIPIAFDPTRLTLADADRVKKAVWKIVRAEIKKLQEGKGPGWSPVAPSGEPEALAEVLRCRPANFEKYLRWYDLHLATVPFRVIAYYESAIEDPERREAIYEKVIDTRKNPKVRHKVKGESAARKGHDLILFAIHRKKSLDVEDRLSLFGVFKCPVHKDIKCSDNCEYIDTCEYVAGFIKKYNKWFKDSYRRESFIREPRDTAQKTD